MSSISWSKHTSLTYAFALVALVFSAPVTLILTASRSETTEDVNVLSLNASQPAILPDFVSAAHANVR